MKWILVFCAVMVMTGCASRWTQEGKGYIETKQDAVACSDTILKEQKDLNEENVKICMEERVIAEMPRNKLIRCPSLL